MERLRGPINMDLAQIPVIVVSGRDLRVPVWDANETSTP